MFDISSKTVSPELSIPPPSLGTNCSFASAAAGPGVSFIVVYQCGANNTLSIYASTIDFADALPMWTLPISVTDLLPAGFVRDFMETAVSFDGSASFTAIFSAPSMDVNITYRDLYSSSTITYPASPAPVFHDNDSSTELRFWKYSPS